MIVLTLLGQQCLKVFPKKGAAAISKVKKYVLNNRFTKAALTQTKTFVKRRVTAGKYDQLSLDGQWTAEGDASVTYSASLLTADLGVFLLGVVVEGTTLHLNPDSADACRDRASPKDARIKVVAMVKVPLPRNIPQNIRDAIDTGASAALGFLLGTDFLELEIHDSGPRLRSTVTPPVSLAVAPGNSANTTLTDFIEDPEGGSAITFDTGSVPTGLAMTLEGPGRRLLTVLASEHAEDGDLKVAATDRDDVCRTFLVKVNVDSAPRVKHARIPTFYLGRGETMYTSGPLGEYFEYDGTSELTFSSRTTGASGTGWSPQIRGDKLEVSQLAMTLGHYVEVDVTATSPGGSATARFEVQIGYVVCCNTIFSCNCGFQYRYYHPVCGSDQRVSNCPRTGLEYTGGPSTTRECCEDTDLDSTREEAGLRVQSCRCDNVPSPLCGDPDWRSTASCSVNRF